MHDISPDGQRFLMLKESTLPDRTSAPRSITVVQNWFEETLALAARSRAENYPRGYSLRSARLGSTAAALRAGK